MSIFINTELKSDLESRDIEPDSKKNRGKINGKMRKIWFWFWGRHKVKISAKEYLKMLYLQLWNSFTGLVAEPLKSAVKVNIWIEANQFYLHQLFSKKFWRSWKIICFLLRVVYIEKVHTKVVNTYLCF